MSARLHLHSDFAIYYFSFFRLFVVALLLVFFRDSTASPKKSPGSQVHAHFFPQQYSVDRIEPGDITIDTSGAQLIGGSGGDGGSDLPRRMYVREQFTHENTVRGNVNDSGDGVIRR